MNNSRWRREYLCDFYAHTDGYRGTGRTTRLMQNAPYKAVFVWCNSHIEYPMRLARKIGREDLIITGPYWLLERRYQGQELTGLVVDHALNMINGYDDRIWEAVREASMRVRPTTMKEWFVMHEKYEKPVRNLGEATKRIEAMRIDLQDTEQKAVNLGLQMQAQTKRLNQLVEELESTRSALTRSTQTAEALRKDLEAERYAAQTLRNDLQRALGYIDRVNESEPNLTVAKVASREILRGPRLSGVGPQSYGGVNDCNDFAGSQRRY